MATRSNILLQDEHTQLWFYRHWDGYPEGAMPLIAEFVRMVRDKKLRANPIQSGGMLILLGHKEYAEEDTGDWKVGSIEPTHCQHFDIDYLYTITFPDHWFTEGRPRVEVKCEKVERSHPDELVYTEIDVSKFLERQGAEITPIAALKPEEVS